MTPGAADPDSPIEAFLDELVGALSTQRPRQLRHLLAEVEAHLRDDVALGLASGLSAGAAEAAAVERFGPATDLARAEQRRTTTPVSVLARQLGSTGVVLGGIGAIAIGLSGVIAAVVRLVAGSRVLAAPAPHQVLSAADCARWLAADPAARTCRAAATADWANEVIWYRIAIGLLGVVGLLMFRFARNRWAPNGRWAVLPPAVGDTIAVTLFAIGGVWTLGMGIDAIVVGSGDGSGQWLSAAPVALLAAAVFAVRLIRDIEAAHQPA